LSLEQRDLLTRLRGVKPPPKDGEYKPPPKQEHAHAIAHGADIHMEEWPDGRGGFSKYHIAECSCGWGRAFNYRSLGAATAAISKHIHMMAGFSQE
jgi:hypothetical protein